MIIISADFCRSLFYLQMEGRALVHREVQDFESKRFINYFQYFTVLKGE